MHNYYIYYLIYIPFVVVVVTTAPPSFDFVSVRSLVVELCCLCCAVWRKVLDDFCGWSANEIREKMGRKKKQ